MRFEMCGSGGVDLLTDDSVLSELDVPQWFVAVQFWQSGLIGTRPSSSLPTL
jgi:hypothetical protein